MKNLRNKNHPPKADIVQNYLESAWDVVYEVYRQLANIETVGDAINNGDLDEYLSETDINTIAKLNAILSDATLGDFATQAEAEAGVSNTKTMTPLRVAQAIAVLAAGIQNNFNASVNPGVNDDSDAGYSAGSVWINQTPTPPEAFRCADPTPGAAVWIKTSLTVDELAVVALSGDSDDLIEGVTQLLMTVAERDKLTNIEANATADQTPAEIEAGYNAQVAVVTQLEAEAGALTTVKRWTPERVKQAIQALSTGGLAWSSANSSIAVAKSTGTVFYALPATVTATLPANPAVGDSLMIVNNDNDPLDARNVNVTAGGSNEIRQQNVVMIPQATVIQGETALFVCYDAGATKRWHMQKWVSSLDVGTGAGGMTVTTVKTANYTASENEVVPVDSSGGPFTVTMPAAASAQSRVIVIDVGKACGTYPVTLGRNSQTFDGVAEDFLLDQDNGRVDAISDGAGDFATHLIGTPEIVYAPGAMVPLGTATVAGAAATSMVVSGFDLSAYRALRIIAKVKNAIAGSNSVRLFYNADTTTTNYDAQLLQAISTGVNGAHYDEARIQSLDASENLIFTVDIIADVDGYPRAVSEGNNASGANLILRKFIHHWTSNANVTSITLSSATASGLAIGSTFTVYGIVP